MKKVFTLLLVLVAITSFSQTLVPTIPMNKNAILEEYTGIHCTYCPQGHAIAHDILENNPGRVAVIAIHQGSFANPGAGEPDYRTPFGDPLANQTGLTGYPSGTVNRHVFTGNNTALGRGDWTNACNTIMAQPSCVNLGVTSDFDSVTRVLTVNVELYYTGNSAVNENFINVALIQDHVFGPQTGGGAGNNYEHMHMLRHLITGQWGDPVSTTTTGSLVTRTYTYTVPADYNNVPCVVSDCQVVAFVTESHQEILTGDVVDAIGGTNLYIGDFSTTGPTMLLGHPYIPSTFNILANSNIDGTEPFEISVVTEAAAWESSFTINGTTYTAPATIDLTKGTPTEVELTVVPHENAGFYSFTLEMRSVNNPAAPAKRIKVYVMSNVATLQVYAAGDNNALSFQDVYTNALEAAGSEYNGLMSSSMFVQAADAAILSNVNSIFYNVAWTFPAFTDAEAQALMDFIDAGGHVFVAGQDIGWDIMSGDPAGHGTPVTMELYSDYLKADWENDGGTSNNKLIAEPADSLFGTVAQSNVVDVNAGNMYPDQVSPLQNAMKTFYYDAAKTKCGALRSTKGNAKVVYFGIGMEMVQNVDVRNDIIKRSWDWFGGVISGTGNSGSIAVNRLGQNYPNPFDNLTTISLNDVQDGMSLVITDVAGRTVYTTSLSTGMKSVTINTASFADGMYIYRLVSNGKGIESRKMIK